tara:strand:+ start:1037 stop:1195 length:159 start_codon:yes stop_codon:yes gene_type:complete
MANKKEGFSPVSVQILDAQKKRLTDQAKEKGLTLTDYLRSILSPYMNKTRNF